MGRPKPIVTPSIPQAADNVKILGQDSVTHVAPCYDRAEAWEMCSTLLGGCSEDKLTLLRDWRGGKMIQSEALKAKASKMWSKLMTGFDDEKAADTAISVALAF